MDEIWSDDLATVNTWASFHHERLDGSGYPFHLTGADIPLGSRIMAVADVYTSLMENRPYRSGMPAENVVNILAEMARSAALDESIVELLRLHLDEVNADRLASQRPEDEEYHQLMQSTGALASF